MIGKRMRALSLRGQAENSFFEVNSHWFEVTEMRPALITRTKGDRRSPLNSTNVEVTRS